MASPGPEAMRRLLAAVLDIGAGLDLPVVLQRVVEAAADLAGATYGALGVLDPTGTRLDDFITVGVSEEMRHLIGALPRGKGILGLIIDGDEPVRLDDLTKHPAAAGIPPNHPPMGSFLGVPIRMRDRTFGDLYLTEKRGGGSFTDEDEELLVGFAAAAGVAIENARLHERNGRLALTADRERIGRELHDTVIQRLFATGLSLQAAQGQCGANPEEATRRIGAAVDDLDATVKHIRTVIFGLEAPGRSQESARAQVLSVCDEAADLLGFAPRIAFNGSIDTGVDPQLVSEVLAVLREALANVAKHAKASTVDVILSATSDDVDLTVHDDGRGGATPRVGGRGLGNLAARAEQRGGSCRIESVEGAGTTIAWRVPRQGP